MSLLIDALRKAEQDREQGIAAPDDLALEPMAPPESASPTGADADAANRRAADNLFAVKEAGAPHGRLIWIALAGVVAGLALAAYVGWQMQPGGLALTPPPRQASRPPAPAQLPEMPDTLATPAPPARVEPAPAQRPSPPPAPPQAQRGSLGLPSTTAPLPPAETPADTPRLIRTVPHPAQVPPELARAYTAYAAGRLDDAAAAYRAHLRTDPNNTDALNGMGAIALQSDQPEVAAQWFHRALAADPDDAVAHAGLASAAPADPAADDAPGLRALAGQAANSPAAAFALGNALARQQRWAQAQEAYFAAYSGDPDNPDYLFNLAVSLDHLAQRALARDFYQRALNAAQSRPAVFDPAPVRARLQTLTEASR